MGIYLKNAPLQKELIISKGKGKLTFLGEQYLMLIAKNVSHKFEPFYIGMNDNFYDCKMEATFVLFQQWRKYNVTMDNPLSYMTEIFKRAMSGAHAKVVLRKGHYAQDTIEYIRLDNITRSSFL